MWYEDTPTVWSHNGIIDYINFSYEDVEKQHKDALIKEWVEKARKDKSYVSVATREAAVELAAKLDAKEVTDAKLSATTLSVSKDEDKQALIPVADYEKLATLVSAKAVIAAVEEPELGDDKPIEKVSKDG